jgi:MFS family permease
MRANTRWAMLALLFAVRLTMAFQFESVAAISPVIMHEFDVDVVDIGVLISLYLMPGLVFALAGGEIGRRYSDRALVESGLVLMVGGGFIMVLASAWSWQLAGRLLGGIGGVLLNVVLSKMVTDWFADKEISTAMGIFVNSWPIGIALALLALPPLASTSGTKGVYLATSLFAALGLVLLRAVYRAPLARTASRHAAIWPTGATLWAVLIAGCIWGLYNAALGTVFGFGTAMLAERGWSLTAAGSIISLVLWLVGFSVPAGGILADRGGRHAAVMLCGFALFAVTLALAARTEHVVPSFVALGLVSGISAGAIMSLPASILRPETRAAGMGIFYTTFYAMVVAGPIAAAKIAFTAGTSRAAFDSGVIMLLGCFVAYWIFRRLSEAAGSRKDR